MSSKAITEKEDRLSNQPRPGGIPPVTRDAGPSDLRSDEPTFPRTVGMFGGSFVIFGGMALGFNLYGRSINVSAGWAMFCLAVGLCGLLYHAGFDRDVQLRRLYGGFAAVCLVLGLVLCVIPYPSVAGSQFRWGVPLVMLAFLFFLAFLRNEDDPRFRELAQFALGGAGAIMALVGLVGGNLRGEFLLPYGLVGALIGLAYVAAFVGSRGVSDDLAYYVAWGAALVGLILLVISAGRGLFTPAGNTYFTSYGAILFTVGILYVLTGTALASDSALMVLTRRELGSFFYSPIAYLTLFGFVVLSWIAYLGFVDRLIQTGARGGSINEPIVQSYFFALFPVFTAVVVVPVLTMRLLSEEHRAGTLEVLLTAPVDESTVVLSKFLASLLTYVLMWAPYGLFLVAIPLSGGKAFDYRPLLSFAIILVVTGGMFLSSGLFFSSLTSSQVASGVLSGAFMMLLTFVYFPAHMMGEGSAWAVVFKHVSYLDLWYTSLDGVIIPKFLLFPVSLTVVFLFLAVKVLESRKWR